MKSKTKIVSILILLLGFVVLVAGIKRSKIPAPPVENSAQALLDPKIQVQPATNLPKSADQPPPIPQEIKPNFVQYLNDHNATQILEKYQEQLKAYTNAIDQLGEVMPKCSHLANDVDPQWIERLAQNFSREEILNLKSDIIKSIWYVGQTQVETCQGDVERAALNSEREFQQKSRDLIGVFSDFLIHQPQEVKTQLETFLAYHKRFSEGDGPLKVILTPYQPIDPAALNPKVLNFIATDPAFRVAFDRSAAIKRLQSYVKDL